MACVLSVSQHTPEWLVAAELVPGLAHSFLVPRRHRRLRRLRRHCRLRHLRHLLVAIYSILAILAIHASLSLHALLCL